MVINYANFCCYKKKCLRRFTNVKFFHGGHVDFLMVLVMVCRADRILNQQIILTGWRFLSEE